MRLRLLNVAPPFVQAGGLGDNDERCLGWLWYYPDSAMRLTSFVDTMEGTEVFDPTVSG